MEDFGLVSILIPVYNREKIVNRAIDSAINQTYKNIEVIVVDNASSDRTWGVIQDRARQDCRIKVYRNESNLGPVKNWEQCIIRAKGKYIKFLWSDDEIDETFLSKTLPLLNNDSNIGFVYTSVRLISKESKGEVFFSLDDDLKMSADVFVDNALFKGDKIPVSPGCAIFRAEDVKANYRTEIPNKLGLVFSVYGAGNDLLYFLYPCDKYEYVYYYNEPLSIFYGGNDSLTINHKLDVYYLYSKLFFIKRSRRYQNRINKYCTLLLFNSAGRRIIKNEKFKIRPFYFLKVLISICKTVLEKKIKSKK